MSRVRGLPAGLEVKLRDVAKDARHLRRAPGATRSLVVLGCQRSGTNALVGAFERDPGTKVFQEFCRLNERASLLAVRDADRYGLRLLPLPEVAERLDRLRSPLAVLKPLVESHRMAELLEGLPRVRVVWLERAWPDVAESNVRTFGADIHRANLEPIVRGDPHDWRSEGASDVVRETVTRFYREDMDPYDGAALFWWARQRLLLESGLADDPRVLVLPYGRLAAAPEDTVRELYAFAGAEAPARLDPGISAGYVGRGGRPPVSAAIARLCDELA